MRATVAHFPDPGCEVCDGTGSARDMTTGPLCVPCRCGERAIAVNLDDLKEWIDSNAAPSMQRDLRSDDLLFELDLS